MRLVCIERRIESKEMKLGGVHGPSHSGACEEYRSGKILNGFKQGSSFHGSYLLILYIIA